ncbi:MAG TPA: GGDEF domain-containing protein [Terriglobales bacterium]|nr:GGDEF domain-containing protein [Terriglobales bacterium]
MGSIPDPSQSAASAAAESLRSEEIQRQLKQLGGRDLQLWSIGILIIVVLVAGFAAVVAPNVAWRGLPGTGLVEYRYLPQLFFGLICLILLFNIYIVMQKRSLNSTRATLIRELVFSERLESFTLIDPLTQLLNRRSLDQIVPREIARANRSGSHLTFVLVEVAGFKGLNDRLGNIAGDQLLVEVARLLKGTFRGSDAIIRYSGDRFLIIMADTNEKRAASAMRRLMDIVDRWNLNTKSGWEMVLNYGVAQYAIGASAAELLMAAEQKLVQQQTKAAPKPASLAAAGGVLSK